MCNIHNLHVYVSIHHAIINRKYFYLTRGNTSSDKQEMFLDEREIIFLINRVGCVEM